MRRRAGGAPPRREREVECPGPSCRVAPVLGRFAGGVWTGVRSELADVSRGREQAGLVSAERSVVRRPDTVPGNLYAAAYGGVLQQCGWTAVGLPDVLAGGVSAVCRGGNGADVCVSDSGTAVSDG